jgi:hypothetical protein
VGLNHVGKLTSDTFRYLGPRWRSRAARDEAGTHETAAEPVLAEVRMPVPALPSRPAPTGVRATATSAGVLHAVESTAWAGVARVVEHWAPQSFRGA